VDRIQARIAKAEACGRRTIEELEDIDLECGGRSQEGGLE
jgi:hypothetical protein